MTEQFSFDDATQLQAVQGQVVIDPITGKADEFLPDENFSYTGYQITREEFFAHAKEPALIICGNKIYVNRVCHKKAPDASRALIMISPQQKKIVLKPCSEESKDSIPWMTTNGNIRKITCKPAFCALIADLTGWNLNNRYKMIGKMVRNHGDRLFIFDLNSALIYPRKPIMDDDGNLVRNTLAREPVYMESWRHQFGLPVEEHERSYAINRFDDYVVISVQDKTPATPMKPQLDRKEKS